MSERDGEILDFLRSRFAHVEERLDRIDTRLDELTQWVGQVCSPSASPVAAGLSDLQRTCPDAPAAAGVPPSHNQPRITRLPLQLYFHLHPTDAHSALASPGSGAAADQQLDPPLAELDAIATASETGPCQRTPMGPNPLEARSRPQSDPRLLAAQSQSDFDHS
jgi:hypothetical protein